MCLLRNKQFAYQLVVQALLFLVSCKHEPLTEVEETLYEGYPQEIGAILVPKCATAGCHNESSKGATAGLSLRSWEDLMEGGRNNAAVIPYSPKKSPLFLFTNTFDDLGPQVKPVMPYGASPLSKNEVQTLMNWIAGGAPDKNGKVSHAEDPQRKKVYVLNSLCDEIAVFDLASGLIIRYIKAEETRKEAFPESLHISANGENWYVLFGSGELIRFDAINDRKITELYLGRGIWRNFAISPDSRTAWLTDWSGNSDLYGGKIAIVDLENMSLLRMLDQAEDSIYFPLGVTFSPGNEWALVPCYTGNFLYKIPVNDPSGKIERIVLDGSKQAEHISSRQYRPRSVKFLSANQYAVICEGSNELRIMDFATGALLKVIPTGSFPQEMALSNLHNYLFVSCMEDPAFPEKGKGSVMVIDTRNLEVIKKIYSGYQPKGLAIDDEGGQVYVVNRNADPVGADAPHHYTDCDGNNGYVTIIDINTLELLPGFKAEVSVDPFAAAVRN